MSDPILKIIAEQLCLIDRDGNVLNKHNPTSTIVEYNRVGPHRIIVQEKVTDNYEKEKSNIYCLDDNFKLRWVSEQPIDRDTFPNPIAWNKEINDNGTSWADYVIDNPNTLTCSSWKGITVSIDYETGKIIKSVFTK